MSMTRAPAVENAEAVRARPAHRLHLRLRTTTSPRTPRGWHRQSPTPLRTRRRDATSCTRETPLMLLRPTTTTAKRAGSTRLVMVASARRTAWMGSALGAAADRVSRPRRRVGGLRRASPPLGDPACTRSTRPRTLLAPSRSTGCALRRASAVPPNRRRACSQHVGARLCAAVGSTALVALARRALGRVAVAAMCRRSR